MQILTTSEQPADSAAPSQLQRHLHNRHLQLIAIGGAIGTGLFMGSGKTISLAGPSVLLTYVTIGFFLFFLMRAMGELLLSDLRYKSFVDFTQDYLGPQVAFLVGWTYWFCWVVTGMADIVAITGYVQFWWPAVPLWLPGVLCIALMAFLNLLTVKLFGELEFWFALIKILAIVALIVIGAYLWISGFSDPQGNRAALGNLWHHGGIFPHGLSGFFAAFQIAVFAFVGIELVGTASAETADPRKNLPAAINKIPIRVIVFYVLALATIMVVTPWNLIQPDKSPFVAMFVLIGIPIAASLINFVVLTSATSSANSGIFSTGRMLFGLARANSAPRVFGRLSSSGVPGYGLLFSCLFLGIGVLLLYQEGSVISVFTTVTTVASICFIFVWSMILLSYIRYRQTRPQLHAQATYRLPGGVPMACIVLAFFAFLLVLFAQKSDTLQGLIWTPLWFIVLLVCYRLFYRKQHRQELAAAGALRSQAHE